MEKQIERVQKARIRKERMGLKKESKPGKRRMYEKLDEDLKQTFPASDPLSYY
jgi:hypothetical protein